MSPPRIPGLYAAKLDADRAQAFTETFEAWLMGKVSGGDRGIPLDVSGATTLDDAISLAATRCSHKDHFIVEQRTPHGKRILHACYIKQGRPAWRNMPDSRFPVQVRPLKVERRFSLEVAAFEPVEPWQWEPGCDVVGRDDIIEGE